jgi:hypothetical protein
MEEFIKLIENMNLKIKEHDDKIKALENKKLDFTVWGYDNGSQVLGCCRQTLSKMVKSGKIFKKDIDYISNGENIIFSSSSLLQHKKGKK